MSVPALAGAAPQPRLAGSTGKLSVRWTTPRILQAGLGSIWIGCLVLFLAANAAVQSDRQAVQTIGRDSAPSVIAAAQVRASMADMDANAANLLLGPANGMPEGENSFQADSVDAAHELVAAAENITYGDQERIPIQTMVAGLGDYRQGIAQARLLHARGDEPGALDAYRAATDMMHQTLLPAAVTLGTVNQSYLDQAYQGHQSTAILQELLVGLLGILGIAALVALQVFLSRRTQRTFNPALVLATLVLAVLCVKTITTLSAGSQELKVAKQDAFDSVVALWQARAVAFDANGDESRYLLDPGRANDEQALFLQRTALLVDTGGASLDQAVTAANRGQIQFQGYIANELNNITFPGERDAALAMLQDYAVYMGLDAQIRSFEQAGRHQDAIALDTGTQQGQSDWAFSQFDASLGKVLDINAQAFADSIDRGFALVGWFSLGAPLMLLAVAGLTLLGLWPRLSEYRS